jgi:hypothetical protein
MKTFETEKHNIPEGATGYREQGKYIEWFGGGFGCWKLIASNVPALDMCDTLKPVKPIPQTNIETPEEKEALDGINSKLIKLREPSQPVITKVEWGGAGLPAVGVECEAVFIKYEHKGYGKFLILGYHDNYVWMEYIGDLSNKSKHYTAKVDMVKFRKPETEAERAEREREESRSNIERLLEDRINFNNSTLPKTISKIIYDAGYRKES